MKPTDILRLYTQDYPNLDLDLAAAVKLEKEGQFKRAGERYRAIGRTLLKLKLNLFAIDFHRKASDFFVKSENYIRAVNCELTVYQILRMDSRLDDMAGCYEKIASFYTYYLKNDQTAGQYYLMSAKLHEKNMNYASAFKKARFACECWEESTNVTKKKDGHSLALRMAMQAHYPEKAGIHAKKLLELVEKDYSSHYISVCMKGYKSYSQINRPEEALFFLNEIIIANYEKSIPQNRIIKYLTEAQQFHIQAKNEMSQYYNEKLMEEYKHNDQSKIKCSIEFKSFAQSLSLEHVSETYYFQENELKRSLFFEQKNYFRFVSYCAWKISCGYGTSLARWLASSGVLIIFFGILYTKKCSSHGTATSTFVDSLRPLIKISGPDNWFSPFYYSVVTFATLGYGDTLPDNLSGQIFSVIEVIIGYLMLGGLLTVFSKKVIR